MISMLEIGSYLVDYQLAVDWARKKQARNLLVEAPDGLKRVAVEIARRLSDAGFNVTVSGRHVWGGCDVGIAEALSLGVEGVIHLGHHGYVGSEVPKLPVLFLPVLSTANPLPAFRKAVTEALLSGYRKLAIGVTAQHTHFIDELAREARELGAEPVMGSLGSLRGLVIGCSYSSISGGDASIIVAGGIFHGLGAALWTEKPVWVADPFTGEARRVDVKAARARRLEAISRAMDAKSFAVVVSVKPGQKRLRVAELIAGVLRRYRREAWVASLDDVTSEALVNLGDAEAYVNTACPRLVVDDPNLFPGPALNPGELKYVLRGNLIDYSLRDIFSFDLRGLAEL